MNRYIKSDLVTLQELARIINPNSTQIDQIYELYKEYIDSTAPRPILSNCNCQFGISNYWTKLRDFTSKNASLFIN
jgi:hypothetical protein